MLCNILVHIFDLQGDWALGPAKEHWLDFGANKYKPYAIHAGATDLHMPFVAQVTADLIHKSCL